MGMMLCNRCGKKHGGYNIYHTEDEYHKLLNQNAQLREALEAALKILDEHDLGWTEVATMCDEALAANEGGE